MKRQTKRAVTLVEILIALGLLAFSYIVLVTTFQGAGREMAFTSEHYTAMFLAQKVLEDVNQRLQENPHMFTELIQDATGECVPVVGGASKYFRLLENTVNFNRLLPEEDQPITTGPLFDQLKGFTVQISTRLDHPLAAGKRNLIEVEVIIRWVTREGMARDYRLSQLLEGTDDVAFAEPYTSSVSPVEQALLDRGALQALVGILSPAHPELAAIPADALTVGAIQKVCPGASPDAVMDFGRGLYLIQDFLLLTDTVNAAIRPLEAARDALLPALAKSSKSSVDYAACLKYTDLQQKISALYQKKGIGVVQRLLLLTPLLPRLKNVLADPETNLGPRLSLYTPLVVGQLMMSNQALDIVQLAFSSAEKCYLSLTRPPVLDTLPRRQEPVIFRRILDLQKIATLLMPADSEAKSYLGGFLLNIRQFRAKYYGANPNFVAFLDRESERGKDLATLRQNFTGLVQIFKMVQDLSDRIDDVVAVVPKEFR